MAKYVARRLLQAIPVIIGLSIVVYAILLSAPGGPVQKFANNPKITAAQKEAFKEAWGLDQPIPVQYCRWMGFCDPHQKGIALLTKSGVPNFLPQNLGGGDNGMIHLSLGYSIDSGEAVSTRILRAALPTIILMMTAFIIWISLALLLGVVAAIKRYSLFDQAATLFSYIGFAMPTFWLGLMLIVIFGATLRWLPVSGMIDARTSPAFGTADYWTFFGANPVTAIVDLAKHLILPVVTLVAVSVAGDSRFVRASMLEALGQDYVRTARAKGLPNRVVTFRHALRNALLPVVTNIGLEIPILFSGALVTESIFSWPGMGRLTITAITSFDYSVLMGIFMITGLLVILANLLADILYAVVDPRIKY